MPPATVQVLQLGSIDLYRGVVDHDSTRASLEAASIAAIELVPQPLPECKRMQGGARTVQTAAGFAGFRFRAATTNDQREALNMQDPKSFFLKQCSNALL